MDDGFSIISFKVKIIIFKEFQQFTVATKRFACGNGEEREKIVQ